MPHFCNDSALARISVYFSVCGALGAAIMIGGPAGHVTLRFQSAGAARLLHSF